MAKVMKLLAAAAAAAAAAGGGAAAAAAAAVPTFIYHHHLHKCGGFTFLACVRNTLGLCGGRAAGEWNCAAYPKRHVPTEYAAIAAGEMDFVSAEDRFVRACLRACVRACVRVRGTTMRARRRLCG
jgi:hypothetical protein